MDFSGITTKAHHLNATAGWNRQPDFGGLPAPCKGKYFWAAEFISSSSKDTLLCFWEHKNPPSDGLLVSPYSLRVKH